MNEEFLNEQLSRAVLVAMLEQGKLTEAISYYELYKKKLLEIDTQDSSKELEYATNILIAKLVKLSNDYIKNNDYANALICYKYIFEKNSNDIENIKNYIKCLEKLEQYDLQLSLAKVLAKKDKTPEKYKILSNAYDKLQDYKKAIEYYNKYLKASNKIKLDAKDYNTIGCHYFNSYVKKTQSPEDAENALEYFKKALYGNLENKSYLKNTIVAAMKAKNFEIEKKCWDVYIAKGYASKEDEFTYCASCLRNGDIKGWAKYYGSRFEKNEPTVYPKFNKPMWTGKEDLKDSTLLVHYEQGYGDNFLMFGYMPRLVKMAKKVIYFIQNNAYELVKDNEFGVDVFCQKNADPQKLEFDYHIPCMSIPIALNLDKDNISVGGGYIKPKNELVQLFKEKYFDNDKLKIAVAFEGVASNKKRDIPLKNLLLLDKLENVQLYCFTKDVDDKTLKSFKNNKVINIAKDFENFADTAAALQNVDIVVSSDNCILNLAGAIGKKTIGVFNYHYEFRWYDLTGENCGWYTSVKPIVNNAYNDWNLSMQKVVELIKLGF